MIGYIKYLSESLAFIFLFTEQATKDAFLLVWFRGKCGPFSLEGWILVWVSIGRWCTHGQGLRVGQGSVWWWLLLSGVGMDGHAVALGATAAAIYLAPTWWQWWGVGGWIRVLSSVWLKVWFVNYQYYYNWKSLVT